MFDGFRDIIQSYEYVYPANWAYPGRLYTDYTNVIEADIQVGVGTHHGEWVSVFMFYVHYTESDTIFEVGLMVENWNGRFPLVWTINTLTHMRMRTERIDL